MNRISFFGKKHEKYNNDRKMFKTPFLKCIKLQGSNVFSVKFKSYLKRRKRCVHFENIFLNEIYIFHLE